MTDAIALPTKKYDIIYADPAWKYRERSGFVGAGGSISPSYDEMSFDDIYDLPVGDIASDNSLLFLWAVSPHLPECIAVGKTWGFNYSTVAFTWDKQLPLAGAYTMSQCEMCLLFRKGKIPQPRGSRNVRQFLSCKRGRHSEKPYEIRERIVQMFPTQSKIELFARTDGLLFKPEGWDFWGNEVG